MAFHERRFNRKCFLPRLPPRGDEGGAHAIDCCPRHPVMRLTTFR